MTGRARRIALAAGLLLILSTLLTACGVRDAGLTRAEVEEIVREEMAGQSRADSAHVEGIVNDAIEKMAQPEPMS